MRLSFSVPASTIAAAMLLAGCGTSGSFPSLAPRAVEKELADADAAVPAPAALPDDPQLGARLQEIRAQAEKAASGFEAARDGAQAAAARAGRSGSDSWFNAQQALSRLVSAQSETLELLGDLDALARERVAVATSAADRERIEAAMEQLQAQADAQQQRLDALQGGLSGG